MTLLLQALHFAAQRHRDHRRKGHDGAPYVNHLIEVARILADHGIDDEVLLAAAVLHDSIEDVGVTHKELAARFGAAVAGYVLEVSDDMDLPAVDRKAGQIQRAPTLSTGAQQIKVADKISNLHGIINSPPTRWSHARKIGYFRWAHEVVSACSAAAPALRATFDSVYRNGMFLLESAPTE